MKPEKQRLIIVVVVGDRLVGGAQSLNANTHQAGSPRESPRSVVVGSLDGSEVFTSCRLLVFRRFVASAFLSLQDSRSLALA